MTAGPACRVRRRGDSPPSQRPGCSSSPAAATSCGAHRTPSDQCASSTGRCRPGRRTARGSRSQATAAARPALRGECRRRRRAPAHHRRGARRVLGVVVSGLDAPRVRRDGPARLAALRRRCRRRAAAARGDGRGPGARPGLVAGRPAARLRPAGRLPVRRVPLAPRRHRPRQADPRQGRRPRSRLVAERPDDRVRQHPARRPGRLRRLAARRPPAARDARRLPRLVAGRTAGRRRPERPRGGRLGRRAPAHGAGARGRVRRLGQAAAVAAAPAGPRPARAARPGHLPDRRHLAARLRLRRQQHRPRPAPDRGLAPGLDRADDRPPARPPC